MPRHALESQFVNRRCIEARASAILLAIVISDHFMMLQIFGRQLKASTDIAVDPNTAVSKSVGAATANAGVSGLPTVTVSLIKNEDEAT